MKTKAELISSLARKQNLTINTLLTFFKNTKSIIKRVPSRLKLPQKNLVAEFLEHWMESINEEQTSFLRTKLTQLNQGLINKGIIKEDNSIKKGFLNQKELDKINNNLITRKLVEEYFQEEGKFFGHQKNSTVTKNAGIETEWIPKVQPIFEAIESVKNSEFMKDSINLIIQPIFQPQLSSHEVEYFKRTGGIENCAKYMTITDIPSANGGIQSTIISKSIIYFVSSWRTKKLYKYNLENKTTTDYDLEELTGCINIDYNESMDRVFITIENKGVYWFIPGQECVITKVNRFPTYVSGYYKIGVVFNGVQGIFKNWNHVQFCPNLEEDKTSIELEFNSSRVSDAVFLDDQYVAVLYLEERKIVVFDTKENKQTSKIDVYYTGSATSMSIDEDKERIVVGVRDETANSESSSWGFIYQFKVQHQKGKAPVIQQKGKVLSLGSTNCGVYDLKLVRMPRYSNQLMVLASIHEFQNGKKQIRLFSIEDESSTIKEIVGVPEILDSRKMLDISQHEDQFIIGAENGMKLTYLKFW